MGSCYREEKGGQSGKTWVISSVVKRVAAEKSKVLDSLQDGQVHPRQPADNGNPMWCHCWGCSWTFTQVNGGWNLHTETGQLCGLPGEVVLEHAEVPDHPPRRAKPHCLHRVP